MVGTAEFTPGTAAPSVDLNPAGSTNRVYTYTPTGLGADAGFVTVTSTNDGTSTVNLSGTGVAPKSSMPATVGDAGYVLVNKSGTASVNVQNVGNGNLDTRWALSVSNLNGTAPAGLDEFARTTAAAISLTDGSSTNMTYSYTPTSRGADSLGRTVTFTNGSQNGANQGHSLNFTIQGTGVAPVSSMPVNSHDYGVVLVGSPTEWDATIGNTGNGNLSGPDTLLNPSNLHGTAPAGAGSFSLQDASTINLLDSGTSDYTYRYAPTVRSGGETQALTVHFDNGNYAPENNAAHDRTLTLTGRAVAPVSSMPATVGHAGYVLVGNSGSASVGVTNTGDGNQSGLGAVSNLNGTAPDGAGEFALTSSAGISLTDGSSTNMTYSYTPAARGFDSQDRTVHFNNGSQNNQNQAHDLNFAVDGTGVAPVSSMPATVGHAGYVLVGSSGSASVGVTNTGDGNQSGLGAVSNLIGTAPAGAGEFALTSSADISLTDSNSTNMAYSYTPTARGFDSLDRTVHFDNGSQNNQNQAHDLNFAVDGTGVAPISSLNGAGGTIATPILVGQTSTASVVIGNTGDGDLAPGGWGNPLNNLDGSIPASAGHFTLVGGNTFNIADPTNTGGQPTSQTFSYTFAPAVRGTEIQNLNAAFSNGSQDYQNQAHQLPYALQGTAVAPVSSMPVTVGDTGYVLVGTSGSASVGVTNAGDGNQSGLGAASNLNGTAPAGAGEFALTSSADISLTDGNSTNMTYSYTPTARGYDSLGTAASFTNGSQDNMNLAHDLNFTVQGTGVAPVSDVSTITAITRVNTPSLLANAAELVVHNAGDGNLAPGYPAGSISDLRTTANAIQDPGDPRFALATGSPTELSLSDGTAQAVNYIYTPTTGLGRNNTESTAALLLDFANGNPDGSNTSHSAGYALQGQIVGPVYKSVVAPDGRLDFAWLVLEGSAMRHLDVTNVSPDGNLGGLTNLTLLSYTITGDDASLFSITNWADGTSPYPGGVIPVGSPFLDLEVKIQLLPTTPPGIKDAWLEIVTDEEAALGVAGTHFRYHLTAGANNSGVPEPATLTLLAFGGLGILCRRRRKSRRQARG